MKPNEKQSVTGHAGLLEWSIVFEPEEQIVVVQTKGPIDDRTMPAMLEATNGFTAKHGCYRILGDHRASELKMEVFEVYQSPRTLSNLRADVRNRAALVYSTITENHRFMETVFLNQGRQVALFTDVEAARKWLRGDQGH